jgi:hypothetical protein
MGCTLIGALIMTRLPLALLIFLALLATSATSLAEPVRSGSPWWLFGHRHSNGDDQETVPRRAARHGKMAAASAS